MKEEFTFLSSNKVYNIHGIRWIPDGEVKGVVQISHGMCEYIDRYDDFAKYLNSRGLIVTGHDHIGHGRTVGSEADLGYFADRDARECTVEDVHTVTVMTKKLYEGLPYILLGHSMGSFVVSNYIEQYGDEIDAAILVGTGYNSGPVCAAGIFINGLIAKIKGERHRSRFVNRLMFGSYNKRIENKKTDFDWITRDEAILSKYIADPYCNFTFTANGNRALISFAKYENKHFDDIPKDLPILLTAGKCDPVGNYGKGVKKIYSLLTKHGVKDVSLKLYDGMRHEIINETGRAQVYEDIYNWIDEKIKK